MSADDQANQSVFDDEPRVEPDSPEAEAEFAKLSLISRGFGRVFSWLRLSPPIIPTRLESQVILLVGFSMCLNHYDQGLYSLNLPRIQADLGISDGELGYLSSIIRFGIFPAFFIAFFADKIGRRLLLMITLAGAAFCTLLTAFATNKLEFTTLQFLVRSFAYAEDMLAIVIVAEVVHERLRGWSIGALAAMGALGHGLASIAYAFVEVMPYDWRGLYAIGALPMLFVLYLRRHLKETERFTQHREERAKSTASTLSEMLRPAIQIATAYPGRMAALITAIMPFALGISAAMWFMPKYLQEQHGFEPGDIAVLFLTAGLISVAGNFLAGRMSDKYGRKKIIAIGFIGVMIGFVTLWTADQVPFLVMAWIMGQFSFFAVEVVLIAMGSELFPTSYRSTASGVRSVASSIATIASLALHSVLFAYFEDFAMATVALMVFIPIGAIAALVLLPETASRKLEDISPEVEKDGVAGS